MAANQEKDGAFVKKLQKGLLAVAVFVSVFSQAPAHALFTASKVITQASVSSASLLPASGLSGVGGCQVLILAPKITLSWMASSSTFASGYQILRSNVNGGPYTQVGTVSGRTTVTFTDTTVVGLGSTYYYVVRASYLNWSSANTSQASATTPVLCL